MTTGLPVVGLMAKDMLPAQFQLRTELMQPDGDELVALVYMCEQATGIPCSCRFLAFACPCISCVSVPRWGGSTPASTSWPRSRLSVKFEELLHAQACNGGSWKSGLASLLAA